MSIDEDEQLHSVALQNAQSILAARVRAEEALRKQSEWLRIMLASIGDAVISTDAGGRVTFMNGVAETLTGWPQGDAIGRPLPAVFHIVHERTRALAENPALRALQEGSTVGLANHTILIARNGTERPIDDSASPIRDDSGTPVGAVLVFRDVTARKDIGEVQARLAAIVESSEDAIISKTLDGVIRSWNSGAERLFGYAAEDIIGRPIALIIPADRLDEEHEILARIARGERIEHFETVRVTKHGDLIDISLSISPIRDGSGRIVGASKVARDISDRKRAEEALREADRRKDQFIALLAHELRNPLAPLRNGLQVMRLASSDANAVAQAHHMMERQLGHMVRLIDDLLDISRISQNKMELRRSPVLLADIISSAVETANPAIEASGHQLAISLPIEPIYLDADLTRLAQVFSNLLVNSAKFTEPGGRIWLDAKQRSPEVIVSVRDTGIGIPADSLSHIFEMFSQVNRSTEQSGGLGIGLALVKGLVNAHGGSVSAASDGPGKGSIFTINLPLLHRAFESRDTDHSEDAQTAAGSSRRILVVDDNRDSADSMAMMLKLVGNDVATVYDGLEALVAAQNFQPQVILMDVGMPHLNGYDATRCIREQTLKKSPIIIALSGWGQQGDLALSKAAGCDGHLVKPVSLPDLERLLAELESAATC